MSTSFDPIGYIQGIVSATKPTAPATTGTTSGNGTSTGAASSTNTANNTSSTSSTLGISPAILSLLQGDSSTSQNGNNLSTILDQGGSGVSPTNPLSGVYNALLSNKSLTNPLATAISDTQNQNQAQPQTQQSTPVESLVNSYNSAINSYNQTLLQTAQSVAAQNDYGANGTPLVA